LHFPRRCAASLEAINHRLKDGGVTFHLSKVKGSVMDRLKRSQFLKELTGKVHLSQYDAVASIKPELAAVRVTPSENHRGSRRKACGIFFRYSGSANPKRFDDCYLDLRMTPLGR